jgi:hypothetical protein
MELEELRKSEKTLGQIYPVIKDSEGNIIDGFHRKRINPNWKETVVEITHVLQALQLRVHANVLRRPVDWNEKHEWVMEARNLLNPDDPMAPAQQEIADALGMSRQWVSKHDVIHENVKLPQRGNVEFYGYNVWGFGDESWRSLIASGDPNQPDKEFYHGATPAFVIHQLIKMFEPKKVLDSMAGVGTTGYVCQQYEVECDLFDVYPYPKHGVEYGDAETIDTGKKYDLIFNHIPYLGMVQYGKNEQDLSGMNETAFFEKMKRVFRRNHKLLEDEGTYAILVGDWRHGKRLIPITAKITLIAHDYRFVLYDEAVKLSAEQKGDRLQRYRATEHGYLAQTFDMVLIFKKKNA